MKRGAVYVFSLDATPNTALREGWKRKSRNHFMPLKMEKMVRNWSGQPDPEWTAFSLDMKGHALMNDV